MTLARLALSLLLICTPFLLSSCGSPLQVQCENGVLVSVRDQKLVLVQKGVAIKSYSISTSKYGLGDQIGSYRTPLGKHVIASKIGQGVPSGTVFKSRKPTHEIIQPNSPGRDPIVTRILWLKGQEKQNRNSYSRFIYIHGTPEERTLGTPSSYGCIRMSSSDVIDLHKRVRLGSSVEITKKSLKIDRGGLVYYRKGFL